jgi:hypothetical protein
MSFCETEAETSVQGMHSSGFQTKALIRDFYLWKWHLRVEMVTKLVLLVYKTHGQQEVLAFSPL